MPRLYEIVTFVFYGCYFKVTKIPCQDDQFLIHMVCGLAFWQYPFQFSIKPFHASPDLTYCRKEVVKLHQKHSIWGQCYFFSEFYKWQNLRLTVSQAKQSGKCWNVLVHRELVGFSQGSAFAVCFFNCSLGAVQKMKKKRLNFFQADTLIQWIGDLDKYILELQEGLCFQATTTTLSSGTTTATVKLRRRRTSLGLRATTSRRGSSMWTSRRSTLPLSVWRTASLRWVVVVRHEWS